MNRGPWSAHWLNTDLPPHELGIRYRISTIATGRRCLVYVLGSNI
jgi:hypothetical protein